MSAYDLFQIALTAVNYLVIVAILVLGLGGVFVFLYQLRADQRRRRTQYSGDYAVILDE